MKNYNKYVIGVDGGGTKTSAILADSTGVIVSETETEGSNIDKIGFNQAMQNILKAIKDVSQDKKISFTYIALAGGTQRNEERIKKIGKYISKKLNFSFEKILVESDDVSAFKSGTDEKNGIVIISGTGSVIVGWNNNEKITFGGWGHLWGDQGSAFWIGKKALQIVSVSIDKNYKSLLKEKIFQKLQIKKNGKLMKSIYGKDSVKKIASLSTYINDLAVNQKNKEAIDVLNQAGDELVQQVNNIIKKLNFQDKFPIVLVGGVFNSKIVLDRVKQRIEQFNKNVEFIQPKVKPVIGAVKLAIENYNKNLC